MLVARKSDLLGVLKQVVTFIPRAKTSDSSSIVHLLPDPVGARLALHFPEASIEVLCPLKDGETFTEPMSFLGPRFLAIVARCSDEITITKDETKAVIVSGKSKWVEPLLATKNLRMLGRSDNPLTFNLFFLTSSIAKVRYALDTDSARPALYMVDIENGRVRACNGFQYHEVESDIAGLTCSLPGTLLDNFVKTLRALGSDELQFWCDQDQFYFATDTSTIALRRLEVTFPDLDRLLVRPLKSESPALLQVDRDELLAAAQRVQLATDDDYPYVEVHLTKSEVLLRCTQKLGAEAISSVKALWDTKPRVATFNVHHFVKSIEALDRGTVEIRFGQDSKTSRSPLTVEGVGQWSMLNQTMLSTRV